MRLIADCHFHTVASGHAYSTITEYAKEAGEKGLELIAVTDHGPLMPGSCHDYYFHNLKVLPPVMFDVEILKGIEANVLNEAGELDAATCKPEALDVVIASAHPPCLNTTTIQQNTRAMINCMKNKYVNIIGHPDDSRIPLDYPEFARAAADAGVLLEVNNSSLRPNSYRSNARENYIELLELCEKHHIYIVVNSDAHIHTDVGEQREALELLKELGFPKELVANTSIEKLKQKLGQRR